MSQSVRVMAPRSYPPLAFEVPDLALRAGHYACAFAKDAAELDEVLRLRYEVFNLELGEGLASSAATGRDLDTFDPWCHHLVVRDTREGRVVGTYRMQSGEMAAANAGFYSAGEFDLGALPSEVLSASVEVGRACVAESHRHQVVLFLLWKGLAAYMTWHRKRFLFGCCSLTSQDEALAWRVHRRLQREGHVHGSLRVGALPACRCEESAAKAEGEAGVADELPRLFRTYLRYNARVISPPAIDRLFRTIDYLVLLDLEELDQRARAIFFARGAESEEGSAA